MMQLLGAAMTFTGSAMIGYMLAATYRKECAAISDMIDILDAMECELQCRLEQLPVMLTNITAGKDGCVYKFFRILIDELELQTSANVTDCITVALNRSHDLPASCASFIKKIGQSLGKYNLNGQLLEIRGLRREIELYKDKLSTEQTAKIKNYKTFGICAGLAIVVILI